MWGIEVAKGKTFLISLLPVFWLLLPNGVSQPFRVRETPVLWISTCFWLLWLSVFRGCLFINKKKKIFLISHLRLIQRIDETVVWWLNHFIVITLYQEQPIGFKHLNEFILILRCGRPTPLTIKNIEAKTSHMIKLYF